MSTSSHRFRPERLSAEIDRRLLTNAEAAQLIGTTENTVWRWRTGNGTPRPRNVRRIAEVFEREPHDFLEEFAA